MVDLEPPPFAALGAPVALGRANGLLLLPRGQHAPELRLLSHQRHEHLQREGAVPLATIGHGARSGLLQRGRPDAHIVRVLWGHMDDRALLLALEAQRADLVHVPHAHADAVAPRYELGAQGVHIVLAHLVMAGPAEVRCAPHLLPVVEGGAVHLLRVPRLLVQEARGGGRGQLREQLLVSDCVLGVGVVVPEAMVSRDGHCQRLPVLARAFRREAVDEHVVPDHIQRGLQLDGHVVHHDGVGAIASPGIGALVHAVWLARVEALERVVEAAFHILQRPAALSQLRELS